MISPGLYCDIQGILAVAYGRDGEVIAVRVPLDPDGLLNAAERIAQAARKLRAKQAAPAGERPKFSLLQGGKTVWN